MTSQGNHTPPTEKSDEAKPEQLQLAKEQGDAYYKSLKEMAKNEAHGEERRAGDYIVAYAVEDAEGLYQLKDGQLEWVEPKEENCHIEVAVLDGADRRFIPELKVKVTVLDEQGKEVGSNQHHFLWHPWLYHYGRNWRVPGDGVYTLLVRIDPPEFHRHDKKNGRRYAEPVEIRFEGVRIQTGQKKS